MRSALASPSLFLALPDARPQYRQMLRIVSWLVCASAGLALAGCATAPAPARVAPVLEPEAQFLIGRVADLRGDSAGAAASFLDAARADIGNPVIVGSALRSALEAGDFDRALEAAGYAQALSATLPESAITLAVDDMRRRRWASASKRLSGVHGSPLTRAARDALLAWAEAGRGRVDEAVAGLAAEPGAPLAGFMALQRAMILDSAGRAAAALSAYEESVAAGMRSAPSRIWQARLLERMGKMDAARELLAKPAAAGSAPDRAELARMKAGAPAPRLRAETEGAAIGLSALASMLVGQAPADLATPYATWALALDPQLDSARLTFVEILQNDEDMREPSRAAALRILQAISPNSPYAGLADIQRAYLLRDMGRVDEAIAAVRGAAGEDSPLKVRALADLYRGAERYSEAESMFDRLVQAGGEAPDWRLLFARGAMRERTGRWPEAEADLSRALALAPEQPEVMNYLAYAWVDRGEKLDAALDLLHRAVALQPDAGHIVDSLGWAYFRRGDYGQALVHLERAVELEPDNPEVNEHLGDLYWRLGRRREARLQWTRAQTMKPDEKSAARLTTKLASGLPPEPKAPPLARAQ